jgi:hypothetical protein
MLSLQPSGARPHVSQNRRDSTAALPSCHDAKVRPTSRRDRARLLGSYDPHSLPSCHDRIPPRGGVISWRPYKYFCVGCGKDSTAALPLCHDAPIPSSCHDRIPPRGGVISWRPYKYFCVGCGKDSTAALPPWNDAPIPSSCHDRYAVVASFRQGWN